MSGRERDRESRDDSDRGETHPLADDESNDIVRTCPERHGGTEVGPVAVEGSVKASSTQVRGGATKAKAFGADCGAVSARLSALSAQALHDPATVLQKPNAEC